MNFPTDLPTDFISFTGHAKQEKFTPQSTSHARKFLRETILSSGSYLPDLHKIGWIVGGAKLVDSWAADIIMFLDLRMFLFLPYASSQWRGDHIQYAEKTGAVKIITPGFSKFSYLLRNKAMVENTTLRQVAVWDGSSGGTADCVKRGQRKGLEIVRFNPKSGEKTIWKDVEWKR